MKPKNLNLPLFKKVKAAIMAEPERLDMDEHLCGSATCIGGWAALLEGATRRTTWVTGMRMLGIKNIDDQHRLGIIANQNHECAWPLEFRDRFNKAKTQKARAKITCERIDHFIETGE